MALPLDKNILPTYMRGKRSHYHESLFFLAAEVKFHVVIISMIIYLEVLIMLFPLITKMPKYVCA